MNNRVPTDFELISRFINGDPIGIEKLIHRHKRKIFTYIVLNVRDKHLADDIFQETFIKVIRSIKEGKYKDDGRFVPWVTRIAHNLIIDMYRKEKMLPTISNDDYEHDLFNVKRLSDSTIEDTMISDQVAMDVRKLIDLLPEDQKEVIVMRHYVGLSFKEIAEQTNVSINTALGRMRYALINLRKLIKEFDMQLTING